METNIAPALEPNFDYWAPSFLWTWEAPGFINQDMTVYYRDVVEVLYDGLEAKY